MSVKKRLTMALAAGALVAAMLPGVAAAGPGQQVDIPEAGSAAICRAADNFPPGVGTPPQTAQLQFDC